MPRSTIVLADAPEAAAEPLALWHLVPMDLTWVTPASTVIVALAGLGATLLTAAQARSHAERLATASHRAARAEMVRRDRLKVYGDALGHAVAKERQLDAVWASDGETAYELSPGPAGAPLSLAPTDAITVGMHLLADEQVKTAWLALVSASESLQWWADNERSGDPDEEPPTEVLRELRASIASLKAACRQSLD